MAVSHGHRFFANKLWNAGRFLLGNLKGISQEEHESLVVSGPMTAAEVLWCWLMTVRGVIDGRLASFDSLILNMKVLF